MNSVIRWKKLTDGSKTYSVELYATHGDNTQHVVRLECNDRDAAVALQAQVVDLVAFAETDVVRA